MVLLVWVHITVRFICVIHSITEKKWHSICITSSLEKKINPWGGKKVLSKAHSASALGDFHKKKKDLRMVL